MNPQIATIVYLAFIAGLFWLDRERKVRVSWVLWIPMVWMLISGSRPVSAWLDSRSVVVDQNAAEGSPLDASIFALLLVAALGVLIARRGRVARCLRANTPILVFFGFCLVSIVWSDVPFVALKRWIKAVGDLAMVLVIVTDLHPTVALKKVLSGISFILLPVSLLLIKYYPDIGRTYNPWTWTTNYGGVTQFKNMLGMTCLICGLGSVWSFVNAWQKPRGKRRTRQLVAHGAMILLAMYLVLIADSMTSFSCLVLAGTLIAITALTGLGNRRAALNLVMVAMAALAFCAVFLPASGLVESLGRDATLTGRTPIWTAVLSIAPHPLIGCGFESFWTGSRIQQVWALIKEPGIQEAHNGYIEIYLNLGWAGLALLAMLIITGYRNATALLRRDREAGTIRVGFFLAALIFSYTEAGFRMLSLVWITFLLAILALPRARQKKAEPSAEKASSDSAPEAEAMYEDAFETM